MSQLVFCLWEVAVLCLDQANNILMRQDESSEHSISSLNTGYLGLEV